jgi:hypothetical protein
MFYKNPGGSPRDFYISVKESAKPAFKVKNRCVVYPAFRQKCAERGIILMLDDDKKKKEEEGA